jgi:hypothetical protein
MILVSERSILTLTTVEMLPAEQPLDAESIERHADTRDQAPGV